MNSVPILCLMKRIKRNSCNSVTATKKMKPQRRAVTSFHDSVSNLRINEEKPLIRCSGFRFVASKKSTTVGFYATNGIVSIPFDFNGEEGATMSEHNLLVYVKFQISLSCFLLSVFASISFSDFKIKRRGREIPS